MKCVFALYTLFIPHHYIHFYSTRQIKEENRSTREEIKCLEEKNTEIVSLLTQSKQKILKLESELTDKEVILKEKKSLISENAELKALTAHQNDRLKLCHQEIEDSREELGTLESIISQLSLSASEEVWQLVYHSKCVLFILILIEYFIWTFCLARPTKSPELEKCLLDSA